LARTFCLLASPLTNLFYKGLNLISTYKDARLRTTLKESVDALKNGENIVIFPENSEDGYLAELKGFYAGFVLLAEKCLKEGIDVPIYVSYYKIKEKVYIFSAPENYSQIKAKHPNREDLTNYLLEKCNALGKIEKFD
jgi:hypothetical protein